MQLELRRLPDPTDAREALDVGLSAAERERAARFARPQDAAAFRVARTLVRRRLGAALGVAPTQVPLVVDASGRPHCTLVGTPAFSITHCRGLVAVGWCRQPVDDQPLAVGIDAEPLTATIDAPTGTTFLEAAEQRAIAALAPPERSHARLVHFVAKEALLKARGTGFIADPTTLRLEAVVPHDPLRRRHLRFRAHDADTRSPGTVDVVVLAGRWLVGVSSTDLLPGRG